jgi:asparagine N-glycosylation enzyme membrane subunit Stt3
MSGRRWPATHVVVGAAAIGVFLRVVIRLAGGETAFLDNSYRFYLTLAENVVSGVGFCYGPGESCALRMPLYPLFLSPFVASGLVYPAVIIAQAMLGGLLVWITFVAGRELFDERAAVVAAIATALNPASSSRWRS